MMATIKSLPLERSYTNSLQTFISKDFSWCFELIEYSENITLNPHEIKCVGTHLIFGGFSLISEE